MFWMNANKPAKRWSITERLITIYTLFSLLLLLTITLSLYWIFASRLNKENHLFLENNVLVLQGIMQQQPHDLSALQEEVVLEPSLNHYFTRIIDEQGNVLIETPHMRDHIPPQVFEGLDLNFFPPFAIRKWSTTEAHHKKKYYLLINAKAYPEKNQSIQIALDITKNQEIIQYYRRGLFLILLLGVIISAAIGVVVAKKGLQPLREITRSTKRVSVAQLKERLRPDSWPTELAGFANSFNAMLDRIEEGVNRLTQFSNDLAHDLRTPVNNLIGEAEIILSRPRSADEYRTVIESSLEEYQRMTHMIESLLFLASAENPEMMINATSLSISEIFSEIKDFFDALAEEHEVAIHYEGNDTVKADPILLRRALTNLISNSLRNTAKGGNIMLSAKKRDDFMCISVADTGSGIAKEHLPHLFKRFYRADFARSQENGGTGLGLAIVKSIMDLHKGRIEINSEINHGTVVLLYFPVKSDD